MTVRRFAAVPPVVALCCLAGPGARAQLIDAYFPAFVTGDASASGDTAQSRLRPGYAASGVRVGGFVVRPLLRETVGYDSNVIGIRGGPGSPFVDTSASVSAGSDWRRNGLDGFLSVNDRRHPDQPGQSTTTWTAAIGGAYDVGRDRFSASYTHLDLVETRRDIGAAVTTQPIRFRVEDVRARYAVQGRGRFTLVPELGVASYRFDDVVLPGFAYGQSYRDRTEFQASLTTRYELAPRRNALLVLRGTRVDYRNVPGLADRDSAGGAVLLGLDYGGAGPFRYRALVGYQRRDFDDPRFRAISGPIIEASVTWTPARVAAVTATLRRDIQDSAEGGSAAFTYTSFGLDVAYEYRRDIVLNGGVGVQRADFGPVPALPQDGRLQQAGGSQTIYSTQAGVNWMLNRNVRLGASHAFSVRQADVGGDYRRNVVLLSLTFGL